MKRPITTLAAIVNAFAFGVETQRGRWLWAIVAGLGCLFCMAPLVVDWCKREQDGDA